MLNASLEASSIATLIKLGFPTLSLFCFAFLILFHESRSITNEWVNTPSLFFFSLIIKFFIFCPLESTLKDPGTRYFVSQSLSPLLSELV